MTVASHTESLASATKEMLSYLLLNYEFSVQAWYQGGTKFNEWIETEAFPTKKKRK